MLRSQDSTKIVQKIYVNTPSLLHENFRENIYQKIRHNLFKTNITDSAYFLNNQFEHDAFSYLNFDTNFLAPYIRLSNALHSKPHNLFYVQRFGKGVNRDLLVSKNKNHYSFYDSNKLVFDIQYGHNSIIFTNHLEKIIHLKTNNFTIIKTFNNDTVFFFSEAQNHGYLNYTFYDTTDVKLFPLHKDKKIQLNIRWENLKPVYILLKADTLQLLCQKIRNRYNKINEFTEFENINRQLTLRSFKNKTITIEDFKTDYKNYLYDYTTNIESSYYAIPESIDFNFTNFILFEKNHIKDFEIIVRNSTFYRIRYLKPKEANTELFLKKIFASYYTTSENKNYFKIDTLNNLIGATFTDDVYSHPTLNHRMINEEWDFAETSIYNGTPSDTLIKNVTIMYVPFDSTLMKKQYPPISLDEKKIKLFKKNTYFLETNYMVLACFNNTYEIINYKHNNQIMNNPMNQNYLGELSNTKLQKKAMRRFKRNQNHRLGKEKLRQGFQYDGEKIKIQHKNVFIASTNNYLGVPFLPDSIIYTQHKTKIELYDYTNGYRIKHKKGYEFKIVGIKTNQWGWIYTKEINELKKNPKYPYFKCYFNSYPEYTIYFSPAICYKVHLFNQSKNLYVLDSYLFNIPHIKYTHRILPNGNILRYFYDTSLPKLQKNQKNYTGKYIEVFIQNDNIPYTSYLSERYFYDTTNFDILQQEEMYLYDSVKYLFDSKLTSYIDSHLKNNDIVIIKPKISRDRVYRNNSQVNMFETFINIRNYNNGELLEELEINYLGDTMVKKDLSRIQNYQILYENLDYTQGQMQLFYNNSLPLSFQKTDSIKKICQNFEATEIKTIHEKDKIITHIKQPKYHISFLQIQHTKPHKNGSYTYFNSLFFKNKLIDSGTYILDINNNFKGKKIAKSKDSYVIDEMLSNKEIRSIYNILNHSLDTTEQIIIAKDSLCKYSFVKGKINYSVIEYFKKESKLTQYYYYNQKPYYSINSVFDYLRFTSIINYNIPNKKHRRKKLYLDTIKIYKNLHSAYFSNGALMYQDENEIAFIHDKLTQCKDEFPIYSIGPKVFNNPICWDKNGKATCKNGNGKITLYNSTGNITEELYLKNNQKDSIYKKYNTLGELIEIGNYKNGNKNGIWLSGNFTGSFDFSAICNNNLNQITIDALKQQFVNIILRVYDNGRLISSEVINYKK